VVVPKRKGDDMNYLSKLKSIGVPSLDLCKELKEAGWKQEGSFYMIIYLVKEGKLEL